MEQDKKDLEQPNNGEAPKDNTMTVAIASLVFGILSCIGNAAWGWGSMICVILGIVGILMAINANKRRSTVPGVLGLVSSLIGTLVSGAGTACFICASIGATAAISATACGIINAVH